MPENTPPDKLEWSKENLETAIARLYAEVTSDRSLRNRLMADPFTVLNERIEVPAEYQGKILAKDSTAKILVLNVPPHQGAAPLEVMEGTTPITPAPNYLACTAEPEW